MTLTPGFRAKEDASHHRLYIVPAATNADLSICKSQMALSYENLYDAINICVCLTRTCWSPALVQVEQRLCIQKQGLSGSELGHGSGAQYHSTVFILGDTKELPCHIHLVSPWRHVEEHAKEGGLKRTSTLSLLDLGLLFSQTEKMLFCPLSHQLQAEDHELQQVKCHFYKDSHPPCPYIAGTAFSYL